MHQLFVRASRTHSKYLRTGYYEVDGLTDPVAVFALPTLAASAAVSFALRSLPAARTLQFWSGAELLGTVQCAAFSSTSGQIPLRPNCRALTLRVPDASRLSETDPRTHGVLLDRLRIESPAGAVYDLLGMRQNDYPGRNDSSKTRAP